jgi:nucleoside-diphosphate-sugar epimerase
MRILVTGARGKVGAATVVNLLDAGHAVTACDRGAPVYEASGPGAPHYFQADLTDAGDAFAVVRGHDAVIHAAAIPEPTRNAPHTVLANNLLATFNTLEAAVRLGVPRYVHVSSETVPGMAFAEREFFAEHAPFDETLPARPQDPYALSKHFGEQLLDAAVRRSDIRCVSIRPSWVQWEGNIEHNLGAYVRGLDAPSHSFWSYIDAHDLADALRLAAECDLDGHEVFFIAAPDNYAGRPLAELIRRHHGDSIEVREPLPRPDAGGISSAKAERLLGWRAARSYRDHLDEDGRLRPEARARLDRGETAIQRGRAFI